MKKIKAYTLMEMLVVMSIMIIILSVGLFSYIAFIETTKYNQDIANIENDVLTMQRASMLFKKDPDDGWVYGLGIDFGGLAQGSSDGTYRFFKWCSGYDTFSQGGLRTSGKYPNYDATAEVSYPIPMSNLYNTNCNGAIPTESGAIVALSGYGGGRFNLGDDVVITDGMRFLLFESVTGRAFVFDSTGERVDQDIQIQFNKRAGEIQLFTIEKLTGRTKLSILP